jgi:hypothetical protein
MVCETARSSNGVGRQFDRFSFLEARRDNCLWGRFISLEAANRT